MKHLRVLEQAGLLVSRRSGREKLHFLNPVPIRLIHDRWIDKFTERQVAGPQWHEDAARPARPSPKPDPPPLTDRRSPFTDAPWAARRCVPGGGD
jgi:hypothetical protein